ncbi:Ribosome control protein 1, partial [Cynara cardunculus var. scolymus]
LFEECFQRRWYQTAACYILVIAKLEGAPATLDESLYELAGELVRFLMRSGREYEPATTDSDKLSPRFLGYFLFPSSYRKQSMEARSPSFKEQNAHVASVKNILESHASYLMSGKELSKLVAFVKGTQFDLVEYLQREKYGSARLENFASGLELITSNGNLAKPVGCRIPLVSHVLSQSHPSFSEYHDLLGALGEKLSSNEITEET